MRILAIIPARGGSKGVPRKNIKLLAGKPLLQYTSDLAVQSGLFDEIILSTDSEEIASLGKGLGLKVPFIRPPKLADDKTPMLPVIRHVLEFLQDREEKTFDAVCLLQVTSPLRTKEFLKEAIAKFTNQNSDSLISVRKVPHTYNPHWTFVEGEEGLLKIATGDQEIISRRQDLPDAYCRDGSIYLTKTHAILQQNSLYGNTISFIESPLESHVNIDTQEDWDRAEKLLKN